MVRLRIGQGIEEEPALDGLPFQRKIIDRRTLEPPLVEIRTTVGVFRDSRIRGKGNVVVPHVVVVRKGIAAGCIRDRHVEAVGDAHTGSRSAVVVSHVPRDLRDSGALIAALGVDDVIGGGGIGRPGQPVLIVGGGKRNADAVEADIACHGNRACRCPQDDLLRIPHIVAHNHSEGAVPLRDVLQRAVRRTAFADG